MEPVTDYARDQLDDELVDSSEEEELRKEEDKEKSESQIKFSKPIPQQIKCLIVCESENAKALTKIIFDQSLIEIGQGETNYKNKTIETLKFYFVQEHALFIIHPEHSLKPSFIGDLNDQLFTTLIQQGVKIERILILDQIYKNNYSTTTDTGYMTSIGDQVPIKFYKTSFANQDQHLTKFLSKYQPAGVLNIYAGFGASVLIHAEMNGLAATCLTTILDAHYVTSETLQAYAPVFNELLQIPTIDFSDMMKFKKFKEVLKEANSRDNNIYN